MVERGLGGEDAESHDPHGLANLDEPVTTLEPLNNSMPHSPKNIEQKRAAAISNPYPQ
jgi:hypothetical protein